MASIVKRGKKYYVVYLYTNEYHERKQKWECFKTRDEAEKRKSEIEYKTILPLCTNEGSGMGSSEREIKKTCPGADVKRGLPVTGSTAANSKSSVERWLKANGMI